MNDQPLREEVIFHAALERPTPEERAAYLRDACGEDASLRQRVEALLQAAEQTGTFLDKPAVSLVVPPPACLAAGRLGGSDAQPAEAGTTNPPTVALPVTEKPGDRIGRYKLLEKIGEGGCGVVYMAEQEEPIRRRVALKVIKLGMDTRQVIARFEAERQALALMDHPNIAKVFDAGATDIPLSPTGGEGRGKGAAQPSTLNFPPLPAGPTSCLAGNACF